MASWGAINGYTYLLQVTSILLSTTPHTPNKCVGTPTTCRGRGGAIKTPHTIQLHPPSHTPCDWVDVIVAGVHLTPWLHLLPVSLTTVLRVILLPGWLAACLPAEKRSKKKKKLQCTQQRQHKINHLNFF